MEHLGQTAYAHRMRGAGRKFVVGLLLIYHMYCHALVRTVYPCYLLGVAVHGAVSDNKHVGNFESMQILIGDAAYDLRRM